MAVVTVYFGMERTRIEIDRQLVEDVRRQAVEQHRDERELMEEMIEESIRSRRFPGVGFRGDSGTGRRAYVMGTGLDVWEVVQMHEDMGREMLLESLDALSEGKLDLALAYYNEYPEEIDTAIQENRRSPAYWHQRYPSVVPLLTEN